MIARWLVFLFVAFAVAGCACTAAKACEATSFINNAGGALMGAARSGSATALSGVASRYTDMRGIAMFALGPNRRLVNRDREAEYVALTRGFIGRFLAKNSGRFSGNQLTITECAGSKGAMTVKTEFSGGKKIVFKIYKTKRGYLVRDVNISSVWLAQQLRSTFTGVIRRNNGDIAALFKFLRT